MAGISSQSAGKLENKYKFNDKELQHQEFSDGSGLEVYDYGFRMQDPQIGRMWQLDPHLENYANTSPYSYAINNPINVADPDGRDAIFTVTYDKNGNISGLNISSITYIRGSGASAQRAKDLTNAASNFFADKDLDGVNVSFDITYLYNESIQDKDLKEGENILDFSAKPESAGDRSHVNGSKEEEADESGNRVVSFKTAHHGTVFGSGKDNYTVFHETGHLFGLVDRYAEYYNSVSGNIIQILPGWSGDLMAGGKTFSNKHYQSLIRSVPRKNYIEISFGVRIAGVTLSPIVPTYNTQYHFENTRVIDIDSRGKLIHNLNDPYEVDNKGKIYNTMYSFGND